MSNVNVLGFTFIKEKSQYGLVSSISGEFIDGEPLDYTVLRNNKSVANLTVSEDEAAFIDADLDCHTFPKLIKTYIREQHEKYSDRLNSFGNQVETEFFLGSLKAQVEDIYLECVELNDDFNYSILGKKLLDKGFNEDNIIKEGDLE